MNKRFTRLLFRFWLITLVVALQASPRPSVYCVVESGHPKVEPAGGDHTHPCHTHGEMLLGKDRHLEDHTDHACIDIDIDSYCGTDPSRNRTDRVTDATLFHPNHLPCRTPSCDKVSCPYTNLSPSGSRVLSVLRL